MCPQQALAGLGFFFLNSVTAHHQMQWVGVGGGVLDIVAYVPAYFLVYICIEAGRRRFTVCTTLFPVCVRVYVYL